MGNNLLIVDHGGLSELLRTRISEKSHDIDYYIARSVPEALEMIEDTSFDAVLCCNDLGESSMGGIDLLEWLRNSGSRIPFILITRETAKELAIRALNLGADLYLRKDIEETEDVFAELLSYLTDRMELKKNQDLLIESESRFRHLFESAMDGILATDLKGTIVQYNESFANMIGTDLHMLVGESFTKVVPVNLLQLAQQIGIQVQQTGQSDVFEFELLTSNNEFIPVLLSAWRRENADGIPTGSWVWIRDITLQRNTEAGKKKSDAMFHAIFSDSPVAIAYTDREGRIQEVNHECLRMFGLSSFEEIRDYPMFSDPTLSETAKSSFAQGERKIFNVEYSFDDVREQGIYRTSRTGTINIRVFARPFNLDDTEVIDGYIFQIIEESDSLQS